MPFSRCHTPPCFASTHPIPTGEVLATFELPAGLHAGPISYKLDPDGKQYLVVAAGGHSLLGSRVGDYIIAYMLPDSSGEEIP